MMSDNKILALINGISEQVSAQFNSVGIKKIEFVNPNLFRYTLNDASSTVVDVPIENFNNYSIQDQAKVKKLITNGLGKSVLFDDGTYKTIDRINNDNIDFPLTTLMWTKVSDNNYTYILNHKLNDENISCTIYNSDNKQETIGVQIIDNDHVKFESTSPVSGKIVINYSSSNSDRISNTATIDSRYIFETMEEANLYFESTKLALVYGLIISVGLKGSEKIYKWTGENNPTTYDDTDFIEQTCFIRGQQGSVGSKPAHKFENNKLYFENPDGTFDEGLVLYGNIDKSKFVEFLKDFTGNNLQELCDYMDTHKEFINGIFIGEDTIEGNFKIKVENSKLAIQRLEDGVWRTVQTIGSVETDYIVLDKESSSITFLETEDNRKVNIVRKSAITTNGLRFGDARLEDLFLTAKNVQQIKYVDDKYYSMKLQQNIITSQEITSFSIDFIPPIQSDSNIVLLACDVIGISNQSLSDSVGFIITETDTGREIYRTASDFEIKQGLGEKLTKTGKQQVQLRELLYFITGRKYTFKIVSRNPVKLDGTMVNGKFVPYFILFYKQCAYLPFLTTEKLTDSVNTNSSEYIASSKSVYTLNQLMQSIVSGKNPTIPISVSEFNALTKGHNGGVYIFIDDGTLIGGQYIKKQSIAYITNTWGETVDTERPIASSDFAVVPTNPTPSGHIFITNVEPTTTDKNVSKTTNSYPNEATLNSIKSDELDSLKVTVVWDRGQEEWCGIPTVNDINVTGITNIAGCTFTGYAEVPINKITDSISAKYGDTLYTIGYTFDTPPVIQSVTFGNYPIGQTAVKEGDLISLNIVADKDIIGVVVEDYELADYKYETVSLGTSATINIICANQGFTTPTIQHIKIKVISSTGSSSDYLITTNGLLLDNSKPSMTFNSIVYPIGQEALKDSEVATINFTTTKADVINIASPTNEVSFNNQTTISVEATRIGGTYNISNNNIRFTLTQNSNGATVMYNNIINIANVLPTLTTSVTKIRTGETKNINCIFDQKIIINDCTIASPNYGTLNIGVLPTSSYSTSYSPSISVVDSDIHSDVLRNLTLTVKNMAGLTTTLINTYKIKGFVQKAITLTYPLLTATVPTIVDMNSLVVSGIINSVPPYNICTQLVATPNVVSDYNITGTTLTLPSATYMFNYNSSNNITVLIEEL